MSKYNQVVKLETHNAFTLQLSYTTIGCDTLGSICLSLRLVTLQSNITARILIYQFVCLWFFSKKLHRAYNKFSDAQQEAT